MEKCWRWFFIGRLAILLAFTPEVRAADAAAPYLRAAPATAAASQVRLVPRVTGASGASASDAAFLVREPRLREGDGSFATLPSQQSATLATGGRF